MVAFVASLPMSRMSIWVDPRPYLYPWGSDQLIVLLLDLANDLKILGTELTVWCPRTEDGFNLSGLSHPILDEHGLDLERRRIP